MKREIIVSFGGAVMLLFLTGMTVGISIGVICMALLTAASDSDRDAEMMQNRRKKTADNN